MIRMRTGVLAWGACFVCLVLAIAALTLDALPGHASWMSIDPLYALYILLFLTFPAMGVVIATRRPENAIGWLLCGFGIVWLATSVADRYVLFSLSRQNELPHTSYVAWLVVWGWTLSVAVVATYVLLLFPDGRLPSPGWRIVAWVDAFWVALVCVSSALKPGPIPGYEPLSNPINLVKAESIVAVVNPLAYFIGLPLVLGASISALAVRYRRARGLERLQVKWVGYAALLVVISLAIGVIGDELLEVGDLQWVLFPLALANLPIFIAIAILRYRLFDIDLVFNRTIVYGALTVCVIGVYIGVVGYLGQVLHSDGNLAISLIATGLVAVIFQPLREWLQQSVDRLMYGERDDPYGVIERLGQRLETTLAPDAVLPAIAETIAQTLKLPYASISLRQGDDFVTVADWGTPQQAVLKLPLVYQSETVGQLELAPRAPGEPLSLADRRVLQGITHQAGIAAHAVQLAAELQASRERIVTAREEERRRLRRDLHDGLGPGLASLAVGIEAAKNTLRDDPAATERLLDELRAQTQEALADIRRVVYALRPPALDELGLVSALREQAVLYGGASSSGPLCITVEAPEPMVALPAAVEVAAYRIVIEALTNVVRHAHAHTCVIRITVSDAFEVEVSDDGSGLSHDVRPGVGISSMCERAAELGGTITLDQRAEGGTRVVARLPLPR